LVVAGRLDRSAGGPTVRAKIVSEENYDFNDTRRSVYTPVFRNCLPDLFEAFDFADPNVAIGQRNVSTVTTQALFLLNSPFVMDQAHHATVALLRVPNLDDTGRVERAFRLTLGRPPSADERRLALSSVAEFGATARRPEQMIGWERLFQALFGTIDFRYVE